MTAQGLQHPLEGDDSRASSGEVPPSKGVLWEQEAEFISGTPLGYIISATLQQLSYPALSKSWTG